jgi:cation transport ATPase
VTIVGQWDLVPTILPVGLQQETIRVSGIRCERCVGRLAVALRGHEGLEYANANLVGDVTLAWDEEQTSRTEILAALARSGFREVPADRE